MYARFQNDPHIRGAYYKFRKQYVTVCKQEKKKNLQVLIIGKIEHFMTMIQNDIRNFCGNLRNVEITEPLVSGKLMDHLSNLNSIFGRLNDRVQNISRPLDQQETINEFCEIDFRINTKEFFHATMSFK